MIVKSIIKLFSYNKFANYFTISLFEHNKNLLDDNEFIKNIFKIYCESSNIELAQYICTNCFFFSILEQNVIYLNNVFLSMCESSSFQIIKWYYEKYCQFINLQEDKYLLKAVENPDSNIFKYLFNKVKNVYSKVQHEKIFLHCIKNFSTDLAKFVYYELLKIDFMIDLMIVNSIKMYNSIDIYSPITTILWLKEIGVEQNYSVEKNLCNELEIKKIFSVLPIEKYNLNNLTKFDNQECMICFINKTNIITNCGHQFCIECIRNWTNKDYTCPNCRNSHPRIKFYHIPR
jgi:hypothetical protein